MEGRREGGVLLVKETRSILTICYRVLAVATITTLERLARPK